MVDVRHETAKYLMLMADSRDLAAEAALIKERLKPELLAAKTNARGSHVIEYSELLNVGNVKYKSTQLVRKEKKELNEERVLEFLHQKEYDTGEEDWLRPVDTIEQVNQDALWDLFVRDMITQEELDSFFDVGVTWAFQPTKE
jgi:hypothetical protein